MHDPVFEHISRQIQNAELCLDPYPHFFVEQIFPEDFYEELLAHLPETALYTSLADTDKVSKGSYQERSIYALQDSAIEEPCLQSLSKILHSQEWIKLALSKFDVYVKERFGILIDAMEFSTTAQLIKDRSNYAIGPHTDLPHRVCTFLFYLPKTKDQQHLGTSIYRPCDPSWKCQGHHHYVFKDFIKEKTLPFLPNSLFGFLKSDHSFHGVEPIVEKNIERSLINCYVKWKA
ncbi:MAG: hypothetical protein K2P51_06295 [Rhabdochlamydiaceae bacterium]|nr:hypothetical protein [Rhabdochlamydiaceae bacterium]